MSFDFVGLENLPNVYIEKIWLYDNKVDVSLLLIDEVYENFFVWSEDALIYDYLKVALVATSNSQLISGITEGSINPHPKMLKSNRDLMMGTQIITASPKSMILTRDMDTKRYRTTISSMIVENTNDLTLFAFTYIDAQELSNALRIALTGPLSYYYGSVTSENVLVDNSKPATTFIYREDETGEIWSGPVNTVAGRFFGGSYLTENTSTPLTQLVVQNNKIVDRRRNRFSQRPENPTPQKPIFSKLSQSYTNEADFIGAFSIDLRTLILKKTKYGRKMFNISKDLFESFAKSIVINSFEIRRQQVKFKTSMNKLGTRKYREQLIGSYKTLAATIEDGSRLVNVEKLSQIYITTDPLIKTYQFVDTDMSERTRGEFSYEAVLTFSDKSQEFLSALLSQMETNISELKTQREFLFRPQRYDRQLDSLRPGESVSDIFSAAIENYYQNLSIIMDIDDERKAELVENRKKSFTKSNYTNSEAEKFISEYSMLASKLTKKFDIQRRSMRLTGGKKPSKALTPGLISVNNVFRERIKFDNVVASYDFLGRGSNKSLITLTKEEYRQRAEREVNRFFDTSRSTSSTDLADLDKEDMMALKDLDSAKFGFLSPLSFKFKSKAKDLTSLQNLDSDGIAENFIRYISDKQSDPRFSSAAVKKERTSRAQTPRRRSRRTFKKNRVGRAKFNFKRTPFKINNLKTEEYLDVSKFLGSNSEMNNVESRLDESMTAIQAPQIEAKIIATQGISVKREKLSYDLRSKNNIFEKFKSSEKFDRKKLTMMPISIKALLNSRSTAAKNNILESESDILKDAETKIATEMIFHTSQKVEYFTGFELDLNGLPDVSQPKWEEVTSISLEENNRLFCRMRYAEIPELGIKPASELKLLAQNSSFMISSESIEDAFQTPEPQVEQSLEAAIELPGLDEEAVFSSSNLVKQNSERINQLILEGEDDA